MSFIHEANILASGLMVQACSKPITIGVPGAKSARRMVLAAGHCVEAFYEAKEEQPQNAQVLLTERNGLRSVDLKPECPIDVQKEVVFLFQQVQSRIWVQPAALGRPPEAAGKRVG